MTRNGGHFDLKPRTRATTEPVAGRVPPAAVPPPRLIAPEPLPVGQRQTEGRAAADLQEGSACQSVTGALLLLADEEHERVLEQGGEQSATIIPSVMHKAQPRDPQGQGQDGQRNADLAVLP